MIPVKEDFSQVDELPGEEIAFGIGDPRWVMKSNAKLYSDITTAIIREYSTNAHDAHIMANNPDPITVTLPSVLDPFFVVEDKGVGMDLTDFREIYTQFGNSNKRDLDEPNGLLGFGSKSGVAYTTSFEVTSVKNGVKVHGVVMRKPDWTIVLKVVAQSRTDEPNGTRIVIPVHNTDEFVHKAHEFYKFWLPGRVHVTNATIKHHVGEKIVDNLYFAQDWNQSYVVMGNVPYRINNPSALFYNTKMNAINFVAYVKNSDVEFTPSREDLEYSDKTKATLQRIVNEFESQIVKVAQKDIASATTHVEAYDAWRKWTGRLGTALFSDLEFKGEKFRSNFLLRGHAYSPTRSYGRRTAWSVREWSVENSAKTMFVTDFGVTLSSKHKQAVEAMAKAKGWVITYFIFTSMRAKEINSPWISRDKFVTYSELKKYTPKKGRSPVNYNNPNAGRVPGSWDYFTSTGTHTEQPVPTIKAGGSLYYITVQHEKRYDVSSILRALGETESVVIRVPQNRLPKFLRDHSHVKEFIPYARGKVVKDAKTLLSDKAQRVLSLPYETRMRLNNLDVTRLDDPLFATLKELIKDEKSLTKAYDSNRALAQLVGMQYNCKWFEPAKVDPLTKVYPLLSLSGYHTRPHEDIYIYLNAKFAKEKS